MSDLMLFGVLRMPYEMAMSCDLTRRQFYDRAQQVCDELECLRAELAATQYELQIADDLCNGEMLRAERAEAEPVAFGSGDGYWIRAEDKSIRPDASLFSIAFYTSPQQRITSEQIE